MNTMRWEKGALILLDQTKLPTEVCYLNCQNYQQVAEAIKNLRVRGAPAIGAAAAFGLVLAASDLKSCTLEEFQKGIETAALELAATRPTAVNLSWALERMLNRLRSLGKVSWEEAKEPLLQEALAIYNEDIENNKLMGHYGQELIPQKARILTHCNAGALATAGYGTALGVIRAAKEAGKEIKVYADETRPLLQGARLTSWELVQEEIQVTLITDNMAGYLMSKGMVDLVIVGADRIAANGDVANKIGTYSVAVLAREHGLPFYVAAPFSTVDLSLPSGKDIPIEERSHTEVTYFRGQKVAPEGVEVWNPAFDVTPHQLVTAIITERGVIQPPYHEGLAKAR